MADNVELYEEALESLKTLHEAYPALEEQLGIIGNALRVEAQNERMQIRRKSADRIEREKVPQGPDPVEGLVEAIKKSKPKRPPKNDKYQTGVFKCYDDYKKCKAQTGSKAWCWSLVLICLAKQVAPLAPRDS